MWQPYDCEIAKARYGPERDGGYVILDSPLGAKAIFGYGVDKDVSFENQLSEKWGIPAFVFDHTIDEVIPPLGPNVKFIPEGVGPEDVGPCFTVAKHVNQFGFEGQDIILKMDVENCEWDVLRGADLSHVAQLIIELHEMQDAPGDVLKKLFDTFHMVHIHANNCHNQPTCWIDRARRMPRYIECTFVRKDLIKEPVPSNIDYPTPLDHKNREDAPDVKMDFWKPIKTPFSFVAPSDEQREVLSRMACPEDEITDDFTKAKNDWVCVFRPGDIIPVDIITALAEIIDGPTPIDRIVTPVWYNGLVNHEARIYNVKSNGENSVLAQRPIYNLKAVRFDSVE